MKYAYIVDGKVANIIEASPEFIEGQLGTFVEVDKARAKMGDAYDKGVFSSPVVAEEIKNPVIDIAKEIEQIKDLLISLGDKITSLETAMGGGK